MKQDFGGFPSTIKDSPVTKKRKTLEKKESRESDSNRRPTHYECVALPTELSRQNDTIHTFSKVQHFGKSQI